MKIRKGKVSQRAYCLNCEQIHEAYIQDKARKWAYNHAKKTGHTVTVETVVVTMYSSE